MNDPITTIVDALRQRAIEQLPVDSFFLEALEGQVRALYGGAECYIGLKLQLTRGEKKLRNNKIRQEFNGRNLKYICKKYELGKSTLYRILRENK